MLNKYCITLQRAAQGKNACFLPICWQHMITHHFCYSSFLLCRGLIPGCRVLASIRAIPGWPLAFGFMSLIRNRKFNTELQLITADVGKVGFPHSSTDYCLDVLYFFSSWFIAFFTSNTRPLCIFVHSHVLYYNLSCSEISWINRFFASL